MYNLIFNIKNYLNATQTYNDRKINQNDSKYNLIK
jgi:hypothetical protein